MRHLKKGKKFHRIAGRRRSFIRNLANALIIKGKIETTETRAKASRSIVEKYVTMAKKQDLAHRRTLVSRLQNKNTVAKLMEEWGVRYKDRKGGYTRIIKSSKTRKRDAAPVAIIEFV